MTLPQRERGWGTWESPSTMVFQSEPICGAASFVKTAGSRVGGTVELFRAVSWLMMIKIIWGA